MKPDLVRWAVLGTSPISKTMAQAIKDSSLGLLFAIGSRSQSRAELFLKKFGGEKAYDDYEAVLSDSDVDVVYIGLPNHLHHEWIIKAAQAKKHILCEKPFTTNEQEALQAIMAVEKAQVFCMEALMYRCHPFVKELNDIIKSGIIGEKKLINATYLADIASIANATRGGSILNLGCYPLSLVRLIVGEEPLTIKASARWTNLDADRQSSALFTFNDDLIAVISTADDLSMSWHFEVHGTKGKITALSNPWYPKESSSFRISQNGVKDVVITIDAPKSVYAYQIDTVNEAIKHGHLHGEISLRDSLLNVRCLEKWRLECSSSP